MNKPKHTPGPWEEYCDHDGVHIGRNDKLGFETVCTLANTLRRGNNARLIIAAPELLEALANCERTLLGITNQFNGSWFESAIELGVDGFIIQAREDLKQARAAIAKAKGE